MRRIKPERSFFCVEENPPLPFQPIRQLFCWLFKCKEDIVNEGYPRYNRHYHVHYRCIRCGAERIERDDSMGKRPKKYYPIYQEVLTFDKREANRADSDCEIFP